MKRKQDFAIFLLAIIFILSACAKNESVKENQAIAESTVEDETTNVENESTTAEGEKPTTEEETTTGENKQLSKVIDQWYNINEDDNTLVKLEGFYDLEEYDDNGNLFKYSQYIQGNLSVYTTYEYDENGNLIKLTDFNSNGIVKDTKYYEYEYSEEGKILKKTILDSEKELISEWKYNEEGYATSYELADGTVCLYDTFEKQDLENGAYILWSHRTHGGEEDIWDEVGYEFDGLGNHIVTRITMIEGFSDYEPAYRNIYGEDGRLSAKESVVGDRVFPQYHKYEYVYE